MRIDLSNAWKTGSRLANGTVSLLPNLILGAIVFTIFLVLSASSKSIVRKLLVREKRRPNLALLLGQLVQVTVAVLGFLIAFSIIAPSFHAADLIKMLGIGSVAIGFAFQNILQNFLAGILLLLNEPFRIGDGINVTGFEGVVEDIQTRATIIRKADGEIVVVPNGVLFTNPVTVRPADALPTPAPPQPAPAATAHAD